MFFVGCFWIVKDFFPRTHSHYSLHILVYLSRGTQNTELNVEMISLLMKDDY